MSETQDDVSKSLISAVKEGNLESVKQLVDSHGLSYCEDWCGGYVLLSDAIRLDRVEIAKFLLEKDAKVNCDTDHIDTPLHLAVKQQCEELVKLILEKGALIEAQNAQNETALHLAVENGCANIFQLLLDNNASVTAQTNKGSTPLFLAVKGRRDEVIGMLLKHACATLKTSACDEDATPLNRLLLCYLSIQDNVNDLVRDIVAYGQGKSMIVEELMDHGFTLSPKYMDKHLLFYAVTKNYVKLVRSILMSSDILDDVQSDPFLLHCAAVMNGQKEMVEVLLNSGFDANARNKEGKTCLRDISDSMHFYHLKGDQCVEIIRLLLTNGADMKEAPFLLHEAAQYGLVEVCKLLIDNGADLNALNSRDVTPLYLSCYESGKDEIVQLLLDRGADMNIRRKRNGYTPFHCAIHSGRKGTVSIFIDYGVDVNLRSQKDKETPLHDAIRYNRKDIVEILCKNNANIHARGNYGLTPLHLALSRDDDRTEIVEMLLNFGADPNAQVPAELDYGNGMTPLHFATSAASAELLIKCGADVDLRDGDDSTPLHRASLDDGNKEIVKILCKNKASVNARQKDGQTPLHIAASNGKADVVEVLIKFGADVDSQENDGSTPLHKASGSSGNTYDRHGNREVVKMLCRNKANVDRRQKDGQTPLHIAASNGKADVVEVLLNYGADVNARVAANEAAVVSNNGCTPLHLAANKNYRNVVNVLVKFGADVDACGPNDETALHCAFSGYNGYWSAAIVTTLLGEGCDVNAVDRDGNTALDCAISKAKAINDKNNQRSSHNDPNNILHWRSLKAIEVLKRHLIKLKAAGFHVRDIKQELRQFDYSKPALSKFQAKCEKEVERLKRERVSSQLTLYDILMRSKNPSYARNELLMQDLSSFNHDQFPIYRSLIAANLRKSKARLDLMESGQKWLNTLIKTSSKLNGNHSVLPVELLERIVSLLNNSDLNILITCGEALKQQLCRQ